MRSAAEIEKLAEVLFCDAMPRGDWENVRNGHKATWRASARTIYSAHMIGQSALEAAQRMAFWHDVDEKRPYRPWPEHDERIRAKLMRMAHVGFCFLNGEPAPPKQAYYV